MARLVFHELVESRYDLTFVNIVHGIYCSFLIISVVTIDLLFKTCDRIWNEGVANLYGKRGGGGAGTIGISPRIGFSWKDRF